MHTGSRDNLPLGQLVRLVCVAVAIFGVTMATVACAAGLQTENATSRQATAGARRLLTETYGAEVQAVIENFERRWLSLESHKDPSIQSELATGPDLDYWGYARKGKALYDEPFWLITKSAVVKRLQVLEYSPEQIKAVARVIKLSDKITPREEFIESMPPYESCGVYVFVHKDNVWKLATYFDMTVSRDIERDWAREPDWSKQLIGDLPHDACE